jgi:alanyl-tRNA synthetase
MPKTECLYYADPYLRRFAGRVVARRLLDGRQALALDRTAFYPTGGGQPADLGTLAGMQVLDVVASEGLVWHVVSGDVTGDEVEGEIDWPRRFDHMQQHTGQHVLSQAFIRACGAETVGFHLGAAASTIDLDRGDLTPDLVAAAEAAANAIVDADLPVTAAFVGEAELAHLPLRKPPKVTEDVRIVQVEGFDWSACGGTHLSNTAQIGLIKVTGTERRGTELRVSFLCGGRARADYSRLQILAEGLAARFSVAQDDVPAAVERLAGEHRAVRKALADLEGEWVEATAASLWAGAEPCGSWKLVTLLAEYPVDRLKQVAQALRLRPGAVVLAGAGGDRPQLVFTRADDVALDAGALLREAVAAGGGRGGGRPDWAQGGVPTQEGLSRAIAAAAAAVHARCGTIWAATNLRLER